MSKIRNIVYGLALGDALGFRVEGEDYRTIINGYLHENFDDIREKLWVSDDTTMSLYLIKAIEEAYDPFLPFENQKPKLAESIGRNFLAWYDNPDCLLGRGRGCKTALASLKSHIESQPLIIDMFHGSDDRSKGLGAAMRSPWLGVLHAKNLLSEKELEELCTIQSLVTHRNPVSVHASYLTARIVSALYTGQTQPGHIRSYVTSLCQQHPADEGWETILEALAKIDELPENYSFLEPHEFDPSSILGYDGMATSVLIHAITFVDTFGANPLQVLRRAIFTGGDSDTIGSLAGAMVGACNEAEVWESIEDLIEDFVIEDLESVISYLRTLPEKN